MSKPKNAAKKNGQVDACPAGRRAGVRLLLKVGRAYRAKNPRRVGYSDYWNDRQIMWIGEKTVQYDSPSIANGRKYPIIDIDKFRKWASHDITDELGEGEWAT